MHMLRYGKGTLLTTVMAGLLALSLLTAGCGSTTPTKSAAVSVKAMKVLQQDTAVSHDYSGQIKSTNAVTIKPRVSGEIVEKYFTAGDPVEKGQPLYKIDDRQYESEVLSAKSNVDKARTTLNNSLVDLNRSLSAAGSFRRRSRTDPDQPAGHGGQQSVELRRCQCPLAEGPGKLRRHHHQGAYFRQALCGRRPQRDLCHVRQHGPGIGRFDQSYLRLVLDQ